MPKDLGLEDDCGPCERQGQLADADGTFDDAFFGLQAIEMRRYVIILNGFRLKMI